jgi:tRNA (guanine-N7-)-methyltransferase
MSTDSSHHTDLQPITAPDVDAHPLNWQQLTQKMPTSPLELEIGSGKGLFLLAAGRAHPDRHYLGIELSAKFANRSAARLAKLGLGNVTVLRGDAKKFLHSIVPDDSVERVHVYFPDPWWRNKHKKRRVLNEQTLCDIQRVLRVPGEFHFWTDVLDYYEHIADQVIQFTQLTGPRYVPERAAEHAMDYTTHFERRARLNGQPVYRAIFQKRRV